MSELGGGNNSLKEYELLPVKPIYELRKEFQRLRDDLKKEDTSSKILVKHLNLDIMIQKKIEKMIMRQEELKEKLGKIVSYFEKAIEEEERERVEERNLLAEKLAEIENQNAALSSKIDLLLTHKEELASKIDSINKQSFPGLSGVSRANFSKYRRTKNVL